MQLKLNQKSIKNHKGEFDEKGFVIFRNLIPITLLNEIKEESYHIFSGNYSTQILPDKIKHQALSDGSYALHSICNAWKASNKVRDFVTATEFGIIAKELMNWPKTKLNQDSIYLIPPGGGPTTMHQDNPYQDWHTSKNGVITAWMPLDEIESSCSPLQYICSSHKLKPPNSRLTSNFVGESDYLIDFKRHYPEININDLGLISLDLRPGDVAFHHGNLWHGAPINNSAKHRHALSIHLMDARAEFVPETPSPFFSRYKLINSCEMHESFFPTYK